MSGDELRLLAEEQAALRRVATVVAGGTSPEEVINAVTEEVGQLLPVDFALMRRYESDGTATALASWGTAIDLFPPGSRWILQGRNLTTIIFETGRPARIDDYAQASGPVGVTVARKRGVRSAVGTPIIVEGRLWGVVIAGSTHEEPLPADTEMRLASFAELLATAIANAESRAGLARLAEEQAALRRVATLVARGVAPQEVCAAVVEEVRQLLPVEYTLLGRYEPDDTITFVAGWGRAGPVLPVGTRLALGGNNLATTVAQTGCPGRIDTLAERTGPIGDALRERGVRCSVGAPIIVEGSVWGMMAAGSIVEQLLPPDTEARLAQFTELAATAIANADSRAGLARLAEQQAALRRVATLVARGVPPEEVFVAVTDEVWRLLSAESAHLTRYESDGTATLVAARGTISGRMHAGSRLRLGGTDLATMVFETGRCSRIDSFADASGPIADVAREEGVSSAVGTPVIVEGRLWGMMGTHSTLDQPLPPDTEARLAQFTELAATAIANAEHRADLAASRERIVAAADEARKKIERDLHDATQQRLISLALELRAAQTAVPPQLSELNGELSHIAEGLGMMFDELREISHGIHPAILSERGLGPALRALARRSAVTVELDLHAEQRFPECVEVAAYYVVSEALTNAVKHAHAPVVHVELEVREATLRLAIRDDGIGGADPGHGSGLIGLSDRVAALGGTLQLTSPVGGGTSLVIEIPLKGEINGAGC